MPVNKTIAEAAGLFRDYRGRRYWFCCKGCGPRFDRDPDILTQADLTEASEAIARLVRS